MNLRIIIPAVSVGIISVIIILAASPDENAQLSETFHIQGIYIESESRVEIHFTDNSQNTESVVLEILGLNDSFQKTLQTNEFIESVAFAEPPIHGWAVHPITLVIKHNDYGIIQAKTEIRPQGEPAPPVIFGRS